MKSVHIGLISAMPQEIGNTLDFLTDVNIKEFGDLKIYHGFWQFQSIENVDFEISLAWSGWGKVSASRAATRLISTPNNNRNVDFLLFTGVAGSTSIDLKQWDLIVAKDLIQYDLDARPLFERFVIPSLNKDKLSSSGKFQKWILNTLKKEKSKGNLSNFGTVNEGLIGTGDSFISSFTKIKELKDCIPDLAAVEMEGAAVAQVAEQENIPWAVIRVISDNANEAAPENFSEFLKSYEKNSSKIVRLLFENFKSSEFLDNYLKSNKK